MNDGLRRGKRARWQAAIQEKDTVLFMGHVSIAGVDVRVTARWQFEALIYSKRHG